MSMSYLRFLARLNSADIHPLGEAATHRVMSALNVQKGQRILEIGCGTGKTVERMKRYNGVTVDALDLLPEMVEAARKRLHVRRSEDWTNVVQADAAKLPFCATAYDRVYTESVLGFQNGSQAFDIFSGIYRLLVPDGLCVALETIWKEGVPLDVAAAIHRQALADFGLPPASEQPWTVLEWTDLVKQVGFEVIAADLLAHSDKPSRPISRHDRRHFEANVRVNRWAKIRIVLSKMRHLGEIVHYRRLLARHQKDGTLLETRLFVLRKPARNSELDMRRRKQ